MKETTDQNILGRRVPFLWNEAALSTASRIVVGRGSYEPPEPTMQPFHDET